MSVQEVRPSTSKSVKDATEEIFCDSYQLQTLGRKKADSIKKPCQDVHLPKGFKEFLSKQPPRQIDFKSIALRVQTKLESEGRLPRVECLKVGTTLAFMRKPNRNRLIAALKIKNLLKKNVSYAVKCTSPGKFTISGSIGLLPPLMETIIEIETVPAVVEKFGQIVNDLFKVFALPVIHHGSDVRMGEIECYWTTFGTSIFPSFMAKSYEVSIALCTPTKQIFRSGDTLSTFPEEVQLIFNPRCVDVLKYLPEEIKMKCIKYNGLWDLYNELCCGKKKWGAGWCKHRFYILLIVWAFVLISFYVRNLDQMKQMNATKLEEVHNPSCCIPTAGGTCELCSSIENPTKAD